MVIDNLLHVNVYLTLPKIGVFLSYSPQTFFLAKIRLENVG